MKAFNRTWIMGFAALAIAGTAYGQQPSTNDTSDNGANTGAGTLALHNLYNLPPGGRYNTAFGTEALMGASNFSASFNVAVGYLALGSDETGSWNSASGHAALSSNTTGNYNTAAGGIALGSNTGGNYNTASGYEALLQNTTGGENTAVGAEALLSNTTGNANTASGYDALASNTTGVDNTASGYQALASNTTGSDNIATGYGVLDSNLDGYSNTASGWEAMYFNTHGYDNTASGYGALYLNDSGHHNTAFGTDALYSTNGINSTGVGAGTLFNSTTGNNNIALGYDAGYKLTTGSDNIHIGNEGAAADNKVIKIGTKGSQTKTYIAGIYTNTAVSGLAVVIGANGELGAVASSERFKTDIARMGTSTEKLQQLRPVTFHYKNDQQRELRYGLIAEEVASVYPELAIRDENGRIDGVRYDELAPMLLNEVQQQQKKMAAQDQRSAAQDAKIGQLMEQLVAMHAALDKLQSKDELVAKR